jgi:hypothetical protein
LDVKSEVEEIATLVKSNPLPHQMAYILPVIKGSDHVLGFSTGGYFPTPGK